MNLIRFIVRSTILGGLIVLAGGCATEQPPAQADLRLPVPQSHSERAYLGLSTGRLSFKLKDIRAEVLVVDCFDMYCHYCQLGAGHVNQLYRLVQKHGLGGRIKFIGLGVGDTPFEVKIYQHKFRVPFPLFSDREAVVTRSLGPLRLPNLIVLHKENDHWKVVYSSPGELLNPEEFFNRLRANAGKTAPWDCKIPGALAPLTCVEGCRTCRVSGAPVTLLNNSSKCASLPSDLVSHD